MPLVRCTGAFNISIIICTTQRYNIMRFDFTKSVFRDRSANRSHSFSDPFIIKVWSVASCCTGEGRNGAFIGHRAAPRKSS